MFRYWWVWLIVIAVVYVAAVVVDMWERGGSEGDEEDGY